MQAAERARKLEGLTIAEVIDRLIRAGADASLFAKEGAEAIVGESFAAFCVVGFSRPWNVAEAYRHAKDPPVAEVMAVEAYSHAKDPPVAEAAPAKAATPSASAGFPLIPPRQARPS